MDSLQLLYGYYTCNVRVDFKGRNTIFFSGRTPEPIRKGKNGREKKRKIMNHFDGAGRGGGH